MAREQIPEDVRRFILTSIPSVPYLEAMLLLRNEPKQPWNCTRVAQRLYMNERASAQLLADLREAGVIAMLDAAVPSYCYKPSNDELRKMIDRIAGIYTNHLVEVTNLIHSETSKKAQQFADAFKFREDK